MLRHGERKYELICVCMCVCPQRKYYSMEEIQSMWMEMAEGFGYDEGSSPLSSFSNSQDSNSCKKRRCDVNVGNARDSGLDMYGTSNYFQL